MMGIIVIDGKEIETEDIDLLVRYKPLAELDGLIITDSEVLSAMSKDSPLRPYWEHRVNTHKIAQEIAEWCWDNGIPTVDLSRKERDRTQGLYALEKCRELEKELKELSLDLRGLMTNYTEFAFPLLKEIEGIGKSKQRSEYTIK